MTTLSKAKLNTLLNNREVLKIEIARQTKELKEINKQLEETEAGQYECKEWIFKHSINNAYPVVAWSKLAKKYAPAQEIADNTRLDTRHTLTPKRISL